MYRFSERLACVAGVVLPGGDGPALGNVVGVPPAYLDDLLIGGFFLVGAWKSRRNATIGSRWLSAAYGCACGIGLMSLITNLVHLNQPDPTGVSGVTPSIVKAIMVSLGVAGLIGATAGPRNQESKNSIG